MTTLVLQHIKASELPEQWAQQLNTLPEQTVTIRIETETGGSQAEATAFVTDDPAFGIWSDYDETEDVTAFARSLRTGRYRRDGSRNDL